MAIADAEMLTRLLPMSSVPISRSRLSSSALTVRARSSPCFSSECMRPREDAVSAVSEPEKKADITMSTRRMPA